MRGCDKKPGRDDGIDDEERRLEGRPHMKKKKHGGETGTGRIMKRRQEHKAWNIQEKPEDPEANGDGWWASV